MGTSAKLALERGFAGAARKKDLRPAHVLLGVLAAEVGTVPRALALAGFDRADLIARARRALPTETT
jgi:D-alanyl-D-alanine carboxypeptidase